MSTTCDRCGEQSPADIHTCTPKRPPNCGTSYCSCIECIMPPAPVPPVAWRWVNPKGWLTYGEAPHDTFKSTPLYTTPPAAQPAAVQEPVPDFKAFTAWANDAGYDTAYTHDGIKWICLNPMTADLWKAWQAATPPAAQRTWVGSGDLEDSNAYQTPPAAQQQGPYSAPVKEMWPAVPDAFGTREGEHPQYVQGWNDCRQAMLEMMK
jgi:hypothetical protein